MRGHSKQKGWAQERGGRDPMALWGGDAVRQSWTTQRGRQTDPVASGRPKRAEPERGKQWEKGEPPQEGQGGHSIAPSPPLLFTQHSQAATLSLVTMVTHGQMPSPRTGPSAHPTGGCPHGRREAQPQLPVAQKSKAMLEGRTEPRHSGHSGQGTAAVAGGSLATKHWPLSKA